MKTFPLFIAVCLGITGCQTADFSRNTPSATPAMKPDPAAVGIYARQKDRLQSVRVWKPAESNSSIESLLAPLIVEAASEDGLEPSGPADGVIHWFSDAVTVQGRLCVRVAYWWFPARASSPQGVRVTLGVNGLPMLWEALRDSSGKKVVYVSHVLESAAAARLGRPAEGRRFSIEPSMEAAPDLVVARVLEDGPVAMGPIVYLAKGDILTVICRCMPSQADAVVSTRTYNLQSEQASLWQADSPSLSRF